MSVRITHAVPFIEAKMKSYRRRYPGLTAADLTRILNQHRRPQKYPWPLEELSEGYARFWMEDWEKPISDRRMTYREFFHKLFKGELR